MARSQIINDYLDCIRQQII